ncbi:MAG: hypothetical protein L6R39_002495 [Caloplaca ligustica]|nr:MAG: hypothetical protein L6R39_002495 [Caloplaca ligustica]
MRVISGLLYTVSLLAIRTSAAEAGIYISDSPSGVSKQALSPATTRLLLARRLGLSKYHSLEGADDAALRILNDFGGKQKALLSTDEPRLDNPRNLVIVEGVKDPEDILSPASHKPAFAISDLPHSDHTRQLVKDLFRQAQDTPANGENPCSYAFGKDARISGGIILPPNTNGMCGDGSLDTQDWTTVFNDAFFAKPFRSAILHVSLPDAPSTKETTAIRDLSRTLSSLLDPSSGHETNVVLLPPPSQKTRRTSTSQYGSYAMPNSKPLQARELQSEAPLTAPSPPEISLPSHHHSTPQTLKSSSVPKPGILPVCHPSLEKLNEATNNCSGHGTPYLKLDGTSEKRANCYACKCKKTVIHRGNGVKTIEWAGPACSKKDVSQQFWLLAGITIGLVATASWGVGLLFSVGQEELPSVIGAGVAGPRAQK